MEYGSKIIYHGLVRQQGMFIDQWKEETMYVRLGERNYEVEAHLVEEVKDNAFNRRETRRQASIIQYSRRNS